MRIVVAGFALAVVACSPPAAPPTTAGESVNDGSSIEAPALALTQVSLGGQWSFDRTCGLYDLVFTDATASYYDYGDAGNVVSYSGSWAIAPHNHVVLTLRRLDREGAPSGDPITYNLDVSDPVTTDLIGSFGPAGGEMKNITAKQCAFEDRE